MLPNLKKLKKTLRGFTLVELVIAMAILGVLLALTLTAINPFDQFAKSRNTKRSADIEALANAIQQYIAANSGIYPEGVTASSTPISSSGVDVCDLLVPEFIAALPQDPTQNNGARITESSCSSYDTGYEINSTEADHFEVTAPSAELEKEILEIR